MMDQMSSVFEAKMGSCAEGHECSDAELAATSVPPPAAVNAFVMGVGGPGGVVVNTIESALDMAAFGSSECLIACAPYDVDGSMGTCEPVDYEELGTEMKAQQTKQYQLSSFLYKTGSDMVLQDLCSADSVHRLLRGRELKGRGLGRKLGGAAPTYGNGTCDGVYSLCMYQDGCNENITCGEGTCSDGICSPTDDHECDSVMQGFEAAANDCSAIVVFDGLKKGFDCLHKYVDDLKGDCEHQPDADMEECIHMAVIGNE